MSKTLDPEAPSSSAEPQPSLSYDIPVDVLWWDIFSNFQRISVIILLFSHELVEKYS